MSEFIRKQLWKEAAAMDSTLQVSRRHLSLLERKFVPPRPYSRNKMFGEMARRRVSVFTDVPVLVREKRGVGTRGALINTLSKKFPAGEKSRVQVGPSHYETSLPVREIMRRWLGGRAIVGVTDLHFRGTRVESVIDTNALSNFNMLIRGSENLAMQEMMTLVIASPGNVTDSHSDDPDGTNHCFFGRKLWLAWDTFEGMAVGLEDVERQDVVRQCSFDMSRFLSLKSSRWFLVSTGDTLFLPGNLTHKVITLEPYLGVGSFHIGLPSSLDSLTRWLVRGPLWSIHDPEQECTDLVEEVAKVTLRIARRAKAGSQRVKDRWGYDHMHNAYVTWRGTVSATTRSSLLDHSTFRNIVEIAKSAPAIR